MSKEFQFKIFFKPEKGPTVPSDAELALINTILPDLMALIEQFEGQEEKA